MKLIEKMAEEWAEEKTKILSNKSDRFRHPSSFMCGWRACREAIAKRRWTERLSTFDLANFGEEESNE